jgi:Flp pilus assembly protein TadG
MRMILRIPDDEGGAVLVLYGLGLIVLLGMLALTLDLGRAVALKRDMVNAADAAALGAAQECANQRNLGSAQAVAQDLTTENRAGATVTSFSAPDCEAANLNDVRTVTVESQATLDYYVASLLGFDSVDVVAEATAIYGPPAEAHPIPITVNQETLNSCDIGTGAVPPPGEVFECTLTYPKDTLVEPRWGVLDLSHWDDWNAAPCRVSADTAKDIINNGGAFGLLAIDPVSGTPDCMDNGLSDSVWQLLEGTTLLYPVLNVPGSTGEIPPPDGPADCFGDEDGCQIDTGLIVAWVKLYVPPGGVSNFGATITVKTEWAGHSLTTGLPGAGQDYGVYAVRLVD